MRRPLGWLCLMVILASPLLCQAKLAYGFGLSLEEIGQHRFESGEEAADEDCSDCELIAVQAEPTSADDAVAVCSLGCGPFDLALSSKRPLAIAVLAQRRDAQWPPPAARRRLALLQTYLF